MRMRRGHSRPRQHLPDLTPTSRGRLGCLSMHSQSHSHAHTLLYSLPCTLCYAHTRCHIMLAFTVFTASSEVMSPTHANSNHDTNAGIAHKVTWEIHKRLADLLAHTYIQLQLHPQSNFNVAQTTHTHKGAGHDCVAYPRNNE